MDTVDVMSMLLQYGLGGVVIYLLFRIVFNDLQSIKEELQGIRRELQEIKELLRKER